MSSYRLLPIAGLALGALAISNATAGTTELETVVYTGLSNSPPNFPGLYWNLGAGGVSSPAIDNAGNVAFAGTLFGDGITPANNRVIWYGGQGGWTTLARNGEPALPGVGGLNLLAVSNATPLLSPGGMVSISSTLAGPGVTTANDTANWYGPAGSPSLMAHESTTIAPNTGGAVMSSTMTLGTGNKSNNAGQVLLASNLTGGTVTSANNFGIYLASSSGITEVARKGNPIPGAPALPDPSGPFMTPDSFGILLNGAGEVVSTGTLVAGTAGGVTTNDDKVVYTTAGGSPRIVARENDPVPGLNLTKYRPGSSFGMASMGLTNGGKLVYSATLDNIAPGTDVTTTNDTCWFVDDQGQVSVVVREGDTIDGETFNFVQVSGGMLLNNNDRVAMVGSAVGTGNQSRVWTGPLGGPYTRIVQSGVTTVPGDPTTILDFNASGANVAFNNAGQIVFSSNLIGPGITPTVNDRGIFGWDETRGLILIAQSGEELVPEILQVSQMVLLGSTGFTGENGCAALTDNGWLVMRLQDVKGFQAIVRAQPFGVQPCLADVTGNGAVDMDDLLTIIGAWGNCPAPCPAFCPGDVTKDCVVNIDDLLGVINSWGSCP